MTANRSELFLDKKIFGGRVRRLALWVSVGLLLVVASLVTYRISGHKRFLTTALVLSVGTTLVPFGVKLGYSLFAELGQHLHLFLKEEPSLLEAVFASTMQRRLRKMEAVYFWGASFGVLALAAFYQGGAFDFEANFAHETKILLQAQMGITIGIAGLLSGMGLYLMLMMASVVWELGKFEVKLAPHKFGVCTVGGTLLKIYGMTAAIWFVFSCSAVVGLRDIVTPLAVLAGFSLVFFLVSFPVCLLPLHNRMVDEKRRRVVASYERLEILARTEMSQRDERYIRILSEEKREYQEALDLPEWPFGWKAMVAVGTSGIVSNLPAIVSFASKYFLGK